MTIISIHVHVPWMCIVAENFLAKNLIVPMTSSIIALFSTSATTNASLGG